MATVHPTADVSPAAEVGEETLVWHQAQVREHARIGRGCILGKGVYVDSGVRVGDRCKIQNGACIYHGFELEDGVFVGPGALLLNDRHPRAVNPDGTTKQDADWEVGRGVIAEGASLGAGAIIVAGVSVGRFAMVGAGAVVTRDVPPHALVYGNPARQHGHVCRCGKRQAVGASCAVCGWRNQGPVA